MTTVSSALSPSARRALRAAAHHLDPVVMIGHNGLTPAVLHEIDLALTAHALIKVRVQSDERATRETFLAEIVEKMGCECVQHLGKLLVLWRNAEGGDADLSDDAEITAKTIKVGRGPRSKLASEATANPAPAPSRDRPAAGGSRRREDNRGQGGYGGQRNQGGSYGNRGESSQREGWAPRDRRGAARSTSGESGGFGRSSRGGFGGESGFGGNAGGGYGRRDGDQGGEQRSRWGNRSEGSDNRGGYGGGSSGGYGGGSGRGGSGGSYGGGNSSGRGDSAGGYGDGAGRGSYGGSRDSFTGKPRGFSSSRGSSGGGAGAPPKPRARRRLG